MREVAYLSLINTLIPTSYIYEIGCAFSLIVIIPEKRGTNCYVQIYYQNFHKTLGCFL